jgi:hypothetical protein
LWQVPAAGSSPRRSGRRPVKDRALSRLGNPDLEEARQLSLLARLEAADAFAANVRSIIEQIQASGVARALTARGIKTARGGTWTAVQVSDILRRA